MEFARRALSWTLAAVVAALAVPALAVAQPLIYNFDGAAQQQGWGESQDGGQTITSTGWLASDGGNPTGHLHTTDTGSDVGCPGSPCNILYFVSPTIQGGLAANYGGTAAYNLGSNVSAASASEFVIGSTSQQALLAGVVPETTGAGYHHLSIGLAEGPAWSYCTTTSCVAATHAQFQAVLATADFLEINADVANSDTGETYDLDNVAVTNGTPVPRKPARKCRKRKPRRAAPAKKAKCKRKKKPASTRVAVR
jgi:hypothetical protein